MTSECLQANTRYEKKSGVNCYIILTRRGWQKEWSCWVHVRCKQRRDAQSSEPRGSNGVADWGGLREVILPSRDGGTVRQ
jgi:hypothetical protein